MTAKNCITGRTYYWELELSERDFKINVIYKELKGLRFLKRKILGAVN